MKVYKFVFIVGILNLVVPFLGIPSVYKGYILISLAVITIAYSLILRTVEKEREFNRKQRQQVHQEKTIEEVVEMNNEFIPTDVPQRRRGRKSKIIIEEKVYE